MPVHMPQFANPTAPVRGLGTIVIHVSDLARAEKFYKEQLGFIDGEQMLSPGLTLAAGDAIIYLSTDRAAHENPEQLAERRRHPEISLMLVVRGLREAYAGLAAMGVVIHEELEIASEHFASCAIEDPDGNLIELVGAP